MMGRRDMSTDDHANFRHSMEGMASLLADDHVRTAASTEAILCAGGDAAMAVIDDDWGVPDFDRVSFRAGAEVVTSLLSEGGEQHRCQLEGFLRGAEKTAKIATGVFNGEEDN